MNTPKIQTLRLRAAALALCLVHVLGVGILGAPAQAADAPVKLQSLRGAEVPASDPEGDGARYGRDQPPMPRDFVQQPPLIPHTIRGYTITKNFNKCLDCHAWSRAKETGATKISVTHFKDREGQELSSVSPRRYFCSQCHVPQSDAKPLVGNTFRPGVGMR
ncbi:MAG TPA: nitrate reductase cytochrome c-type subunit [Zoogloea sp.]|uniref:nitrate reductase cytochrome c-type subunit n=1 Tax=Zoogloea sp. TaxID=49181 RepID=UPI002C9ED516|nr:nitrate reductase cytochrome c-type subunit [Zoogloea sp.]HMV18662.1 nitrate reductase cytochrome c-type subunit [Rhodocyclaceae bacterium]HMV62429.1 nitrate reductase cytochrome c-type subunit [Rhodocyclaceae bacterium]HMW51971.1 nitrate reductase cytochrome c-type subunit [Rhodocyclaceae bacterium]HMY49858.1 nitrate reductase cytochrome c-type subunit [Rhodocyclaceae bacterium]HMZ76623.1 nitrate reductase cytochrome c-type subunit [Rhodocyclaceae bacterium]